MRFLICGGRDFGETNEEWSFITTTLDKIITYDKYDYIVVINGMARGVDNISSEWAKARDIPVIEYPAEWDKYGKAAGFRRNREMLVEGKPDWVLAFPGGTGTQMMCDIATRAGVRVKRFEYPHVDFIA